MLRVKTDILIELLSDEVNKRGISVREIARKSDVDHVTLLNIMQGKSVPELRTLGKLADYFQINAFELLDTGEAVISLNRLPSGKRDKILKIITE